jgi:hypothetical protein
VGKLCIKENKKKRQFFVEKCWEIASTGFWKSFGQCQMGTGDSLGKAERVLETLQAMLQSIGDIL